MRIKHLKHVQLLKNALLNRQTTHVSNISGHMLQIISRYSPVKLNTREYFKTL